MRYIYTFLVLCVVANVSAQSSVKGTIALNSSSPDYHFVVRNTKVVLLTKTSRDTISVNDQLEFEFPNAVAGTAFLYLSSPLLASRTEYKFRIKKNKPTRVTLKYNQFQAESNHRVRTPEERQQDLVKGLFFARLAADIIIIVATMRR